MLRYRPPSTMVDMSMGDQQLQHHLSDAEYQGGCRPALITARGAQVPEKARFFCLDKDVTSVSFMQDF